MNVQSSTTIIQKATKILAQITHLPSFALVSCFLFLFLYFTDYTLFTLIPAHYHPAQHGYIIVIPLTLIIIYFGMLIFFNYFMTVLTEPGSPNKTNSDNLHMISINCSKCRFPKPKRTHHCSVCNQCIFQMDHHCPWMWNCIGHFNRRYFISFLSTLSLQLFFLWMLNLKTGVEVRRKNEFVQMFDIIMGVVFSIISAFALFHWYLVFRGKTSLQLGTSQDHLREWSKMERFQLVFGSRNVLIAFFPNLLELECDGILWDKNLSQTY